jgi:cytochrome c-type biogenesis protein CcmH/NrfG
VVITGIAYSGSFDGEFVSDDIRRVRDNTLIRSLDWNHIREIFTTFDGANYMPIKVLSLAIDYQLWGPSPTGFHVTNLIIHIACALVIYAVLVRLGIPSGAACLTALLWAVHPLQVESVAWISERKNVLSGLFFFAAFYVYLGFSDHGRIGNYLGILVLYILAVLTKMNTMVLPAICLAYEGTFRFRLRARDVAASLPLFAIAAAAGWYNLSSNPIHGTSYHGGSAIVTWISSSVVVFRYLGLLLLPTNLMAWYHVPLRDSLLDPPVLLSVLGLVAIVATTVWLISARHTAGFWVLWFGISFAPMLNIFVPFRSLMQDRYMYLPMLGPLALAATYLSSVTHSPAARRGGAAAAGAAIVACTVLTYRQVEVWTNAMTRWKAAIVHQPWIPGDQVRVPEDFEVKVAYLRGALARNPSSAVIHSNLGAQYFSAGQTEEALTEFETADRLAPNDATILLNLGRAYGRSGQLATAEHVLTRAAGLAPYSFVTRLSLARVHLALGNADAARSELDACARIRPASPWAGSQERAYLRRLEAAQRRGGP